MSVWQLILLPLLVFFFFLSILLPVLTFQNILTGFIPSRKKYLEQPGNDEQHAPENLKKMMFADIDKLNVN